VQLVLSPKDRERLGCPETLPIELDRLTNREAMALQRMGFRTIRALQKRLEVKQVEGDDLDMEMDYAAWTALVWLALQRAGCEQDFEGLDFDLFGLRIKGEAEVEPADESPGKAPARGGLKTSPKTKPTPGST